MHNNLKAFIAQSVKLHKSFIKKSEERKKEHKGNNFHGNKIKTDYWNVLVIAHDIVSDVEPVFEIMTHSL